MRRILSAFALASLVVATGCGAPALTCQPETCPTGGKTYQLCVNIDASESYNFGGMSCSCSAANCQSCQTMIAAYCGGGGGGTGGTGGGGGGGGSTCNITLSGAVTGMFACTSLMTYASSSNLGGVTLTVSSPAPLQNVHVTIQKPGMPMTGTWSNSDVGGSAGLVVQQMGALPPTWEAAKGGTGDQGTYSMTATVTGSAPLYGGTGSITAALPALMGTGSAGTVSLTATF